MNANSDFYTRPVRGYSRPTGPCESESGDGGSCQANRRRAKPCRVSLLGGQFRHHLEEAMFMRVPFAMLAVVVVWSTPVAAADNIRYVSTTGNNANTCTLSAPCRSLQRGINVTPANGELRILNWRLRFERRHRAVGYDHRKRPYRHTRQPDYHQPSKCDSGTARVHPRRPAHSPSRHQHR